MAGFQLFKEAWRSTAGSPTMPSLRLMANWATTTTP